MKREQGRRRRRATGAAAQFIEQLEGRCMLAVTAVGGFVWNDTNGNGIRDAGETGHAGITVTLYTGAGATVGTTTTAADGTYQFSGLTGGSSYYLQFARPNGVAYTLPNAGSDDSVDSDASTGDGHTAVFTAVASQTDLSWSMGLTKSASIDVYPFDDLNSNGVQDAYEPTVEAYFAAFLDENGNGQLDPGEQQSASPWPWMSFTDVSPGVQSIVMLPRLHWTQTTPAANLQVNVVPGGSLKVYVGVHTDVVAEAVSIVGSDFQVSSSKDDFSAPAMAGDAAGDFVIVWQSTPNIYARRYSADGQAQGGDMLVGSTGTQVVGGRRSVVAMTPSGDFMVAWWKLGQLHARHYDPTTQTFGAEFNVDADAGAGPAIATDASGNFIFSWSDGSSAYVRRYNLAGTPITAKINIGSDIYVHNRSIVGTPDGGFAMTWSESGFTTDTTYVQRYSSANQAVGTKLRLNGPYSYHAVTPAITADGAGNLLATWSCPSDQPAIYTRGLTATGRLDPSSAVNGMISFMNNSNNINPGISMNPYGSFAVAWLSGTSVFMRKYSASGGKVQEEVAINTLASTAGTPAIVVRKMGAWWLPGLAAIRAYTRGFSPRRSRPTRFSPAVIGASNIH